MMISNYETWLKATFGEDKGSKMAATYKADLERQENWVSQFFKGLTGHEGDWLVEGVTEPGESRCQQALLKVSKNGTAFYSVSLRWALADGNKIGDSAGYFVLVDG